MTILFDTNVILDVLLKREHFMLKSSHVLLLSEKKIIDGYVTASSITDIFYLTNKTYNDKQKSMGLLTELLKTISIATVSGEEIYSRHDRKSLVFVNWLVTQRMRNEE